MSEITSAAAATLWPQYLRYAITIGGAITVGAGWVASDDWQQFGDNLTNLVGAVATFGPPLYLAVKAWIVRAKAAS